MTSPSLKAGEKKETMKKEKWIEDVLQSAKAVKPVASNPYLASRIEAKLWQTPVERNMPLRLVYVSAVAIMFLLMVNITVWSSKTPSSKNDGVQQLMQEYGWSSNDLYSANISNRPNE